MLSFHEWLIESFGAEEALARVTTPSATTKKKIIGGLKRSDVLACYLAYTWDCEEND